MKIYGLHLPDPTQPSGKWDKAADKVATIVGSWKFITIQSTLLALWIMVNLLAWHYRWDPYPFILLNLVLSFQAAFTAPIIMMSQNRQSEIDRKRAENDYKINVKAEQEIRELHTKLDDIIRRLNEKA